MLHIIKRPQQLALIRRYLLDTDSIMLIEDAVYATSPHSRYFVDLAAIQQVYALREDLAARGWLEQCATSIQPLTMEQFVELTVSSLKSISWS